MAGEIFLVDYWILNAVDSIKGAINISCSPNYGAIK